MYDFQSDHVDNIVVLSRYFQLMQSVAWNFIFTTANSLRIFQGTFVQTASILQCSIVLQLQLDAVRLS